MSLFEALEDPEYVKAYQEFNSGLAAIEEKYSYWFEKREPKFEWDKYDRLSNHHQFYKNGSEIMFWFDEDSEVPAEIKQECSTLFNRCFTKE